ncbi:MAG: hypothetical protein O3B41_07190 [Bacteroidetes bacterium]|nr:hypothetical protein [Bacteroidota bacterium]
MNLRKSIWISALAVLAILMGCQLAGCQSVEEDPIAGIEGLWGADHIEIVSDSNGIRVEYDCGRGQINGPFVVDSTGRFQLTGNHTPEGGPVPTDPPDPLPAVYQGRIVGNRMELSVVLVDSGIELGPFVLFSGQSGRLVKCK